MNELKEKTKVTEDYIKSKTNKKPQIGLMLGSGLGALAEKITDSDTLYYKDIPNFPVSTVEGHKGCLVIGKFQGKDVLGMQGRFHFYEGYSMQKIIFPIYVMKALGIKTLIVTNAAGGINTNFKPGDLMLITDHINLMGTNPLIGANDDNIGPRFPDMSEAYNEALRKKALNAAQENNIDLKTGVYLGLTGPSYETPAEIRMARAIGADAVGMSTVPEVIAANHCGIKCLGISCITNMAAGITKAPLNHEEVIKTTCESKKRFETLVEATVKSI